MNLYPPLLFNRVRIRKVSHDFMEVDVRVYKSLLNRNLNRSIFGGSIFSAADPIHSMMYWKALRKRNVKCIVWLKSAYIRYRKPARTSLDYHFHLSEEDLHKAISGLRQDGRYEIEHYVNAIDQTGDVCAEVRACVHIRIVQKEEESLGAF